MRQCNDLQGHSLHMREGPWVLALPRRRAYTGPVVASGPGQQRQATEVLVPSPEQFTPGNCTNVTVGETDQ